jgi:hypothetical protein
LDGRKRTVGITTGPPNSVARLVNRVSYQLYTRTYQHCYTAASIRSLIRDAFADTPLRPRFATTSAPADLRFAAHSQRLYDDGCVRFEYAFPGNDDRHIDVGLYAREAPALPADHLYPPAQAFGP